MSILVIGATGTVGSLVVDRLAAAGAPVKALVRQPGKRPFPGGVTEVVGDLSDVPALRAALSSVRTLFLLNAVVPDEVTQALITLNLAREAGIERIVYLSVIHADRYTNVPHFTGKHTVERMLEALDMPATILRPASRATACTRCRSARPAWPWWTCATSPTWRWPSCCAATPHPRRCRASRWTWLAPMC